MFNFKIAEQPLLGNGGAAGAGAAGAKGLHVELGATGGVVTTAQSRGNSSLPLYHVPGAPSKSFRCLGRDCCECNCFVCYLMLGMLGFVIFWSLLMLRIYLPERYWEWSYIWRTEEEEGGGGGGTTEAPTTTNSSAVLGS